MISLSDYLAAVSAETIAQLRRSGRLPHNHMPLSGSLVRAAGLPAIIGREPAAGASSQPPTEPPPGAVPATTRPRGPDRR